VVHRIHDAVRHYVWAFIWIACYVDLLCFHISRDPSNTWEGNPFANWIYKQYGGLFLYLAKIAVTGFAHWVSGLKNCQSRWVVTLCYGLIHLYMVGVTIYSLHTYYHMVNHR
jgi:hypothetical protein